MKKLGRVILGLFVIASTVSRVTPLWGAGVVEINQPSPSSQVFVPPPGTTTALDLEWSEVPGATSYEIQVHREGGLPIRMTARSPRVSFAPLTPGPEGSPVSYTWSVTPYRNGLPDPTGPEQTFTLEHGAPVSYETTPEGLPAPANLAAEVFRPTVPYVMLEGLYMRWNDVPGASEYEVQLILLQSLRGAPIHQLHYRLRVRRPHALVTNITQTGKYRFDVRAVDSEGIRGNPASGFFYLVESFLDVTGDRVLDHLDLIRLGADWLRTATGSPPLEGDVIGDGTVDQEDLLTLLIRLNNSSQPLPGTSKKKKRQGVSKNEIGSPHPVESRRPKRLKTSWLHRLGSWTFGAPVAAGTVPEGTTAEIESPFIIFPACHQRVPSSVFEIVWSEVKDATTYQVELYLSLGNQNIPLPLIDEDDSEGNLRVVTDEVVGDGVVRASALLTFQGGLHTVRVRARVGNREGPFSRKQVFYVDNSPPPSPDFRFIDLDFNNNNLFDGADVLVFAARWQSATGESGYDTRFDLYPSEDLDGEIQPDGVVNAQDLIKYLQLFHQRCGRPKSPALDAPTPQRPLQNELFPTPQENFFIVPFEFTPPPATEFSNPSVYQIEVVFPNSSAATTFFTAQPFTEIQFLLGGRYFWRVRAIADDGTPGDWSNPVQTFVVDTPTTGVAAPTLISPTDGAVFQAGEKIRFAWSREKQVFPNVCRFDRLEIYNGDVLSVSFDYYHHASKADDPTVTFELPLYPNFGPDFRWRVVPYEELTDNIPQLLQFSGESTEFRQFRIERDPNQAPWVVSGLAAWKADQDDDGRFGLTDLALLQRTWKGSHDRSRTYDINFDFDYSGSFEPRELIQFLETAAGRFTLVNNGLEAPVPITPRSASEAVLVTNTGPGVQLVWFDPNFGTDRFLVEWIDNNRWFRGHYVDRMDAPTLISPASGETLVLDDADATLRFVWDTIPDAQEYDLVLKNLEDDFTMIRSVLPASVSGATQFTEIPASLLIRDSTPAAPGLTRYSVQVFPKACAHFVSGAGTTEVKVQIDFTPEKILAHAEKKKPRSLNKVLNLPIQLEGTARIFARQSGLHHWRVTPVAPDGALGNPMRWQSFGAEDRGPAFPED